MRPPQAAPMPYPEGMDAVGPSLRVATFNASLNRPHAGQLALDLATPLDPQAQAVAEIVQRNAPDVLLLNEFDYDAAGTAATGFKDNYLGRPQSGQNPVDYPYMYAAPSNTGIPSGADLDGDGIVGGPADALGYGDFEGQYGMVLFSKYPIDTAERAHLPELPVEGHARLPAADEALRRTGPRGAAPAQQVHVGRAGHRRRQDNPRHCRPPHAAGLRRPGKAQPGAQPRRDPADQRLPGRRAGRELHLRRCGQARSAGGRAATSWCSGT